MSGKEEELIVTTSLLKNNQRISGVSDDKPTWYSNTNYCAIEIQLSNPIVGKLSVNQGTGQGSSYTLFYSDDTYLTRINSSPNPNTITLSNPCNRILLSVHKPNRLTRACIQFANGKYLWNGADEDWSRLGI